MLNITPSPTDAEFVNKIIKDKPNNKQFTRSIYCNPRFAPSSHKMGIEYSQAVGCDHRYTDLDYECYMHSIDIKEFRNLLEEYFKGSDIEDIGEIVNNKDVCISGDIVIYLLEHFDLDYYPEIVRIDPGINRDKYSNTIIYCKDKLTYSDEFKHKIVDNLNLALTEFVPCIRGMVYMNKLYFTESCLDSFKSRMIIDIMLNPKLGEIKDCYLEMIEYMKKGFYPFNEDEFSVKCYDKCVELGIKLEKDNVEDTTGKSMLYKFGKICIDGSGDVIEDTRKEEILDKVVRMRDGRIFECDGKYNNVYLEILRLGRNKSLDGYRNLDEMRKVWDSFDEDELNKEDKYGDRDRSESEYEKENENRDNNRGGYGNDSEKLLSI